MLPPEVSIVIRAYNAELFIQDAMLSAVNQSPLIHGHEIVVVDDGSTDGTLAIATGIQQQLPRDFVRVIPTDNRGPAAAANIGVAIARAPKIIFLDSDDLLDPKAAFILSQGLDKSGVASGEKRGFRRGKRGEIIYTFSPTSSKKSQLLRRSDRPEDYYYLHANILGAPRAFRRIDYERTDGSDESMYIADDYDLGLRLVFPGTDKPVSTTHHVLYYHRKLDTSQSTKYRARQLFEAEIAIDRALSRLGISGIRASAAGRDNTGYLYFAHVPVQSETGVLYKRDQS